MGGAGLGQSTSGAGGGAESVGQGLGEALDVGVVFSLNHDACEVLGAGVTENDAAIVAKGRLGFGEGAGDFRESVERGFRTDLHIDDKLRVVLETFDERFNLSVHRDQRSDLDGGEQAV